VEKTGGDEAVSFLQAQPVQPAQPTTALTQCDFLGPFLANLSSFEFGALNVPPAPGDFIQWPQA